MINIADYIPTGSKNAVSIKYLMSVTGLTNRDIRKALEIARKDEAIINLQDGNGYFKPSKKDEQMVRKYLKQELSRSRAITRSLAGVKKYINGLK